MQIPLSTHIYNLTISVAISIFQSIKFKNTTDAPYVTFRVNGEGFDACFTSNGKLNIALTETGDIIEKDIPWRVLMIKDNKDNVIYNITTDLI